MQRIIGLFLLLCCVFSLYAWTFEPENVKVAGNGVSIAEDAYGNKMDANGFVVAEYYDDELSGEFYDAGKKPFVFINDVGNAFNGMRTGIVAIISSSTKMTEELTAVLDSIFNFNDNDSWWANLWYSFDENNENDKYPGGSRGKR